jgi:hypothetical protein
MVYPITPQDYVDKPAKSTLFFGLLASLPQLTHHVENIPGSRVKIQGRSGERSEQRREERREERSIRIKFS